MATTTFAGPIKAGSIREGASANVGFVRMAQTADWTQSTTAADTGITIPANSQITEIRIYITTATTAANISMGFSSTTTELFTGLAAGTAANVVKLGSAGTIADIDDWVDVGSSDVPIFIDFSAGTAGAGYVTVEYIQNINNA
jgi:hypothetical protein